MTAAAAFVAGIVVGVALAVVAAIAGAAVVVYRETARGRRGGDRP